MYLLGYCPKYISVIYGQRGSKDPVLEERTVLLLHGNMGMRPGKGLSTRHQESHLGSLPVAQTQGLTCSPPS